MRKINIFYYLKGQNLNYLFVVLLALLMPFKKELLPYLVSLSFLSWVFQKNILTKVRGAFKFNYFLFIFFFYILCLAGLLYTANIKRGLFDVQIKLSLLIFPIIFFSSSNYFIERKKYVINSFIIGNLIASLICISYATYRSFKNGGDEIFSIVIWPGMKNWSFFKLLFSGYSLYNYDSLSVFMHPSYFSIHLILSIYFIYDKLFLKKSIETRKGKIVNYSLLVFFLIMILLIQARGTIVAIVIISAYEIIVLFLTKKDTKLKIGLSILVVLFVLLVSGSFTRFFTLKEGISKGSYGQLKKENVRIQLWEKAIEVIKKNVLFGVGTGDIKDELMAKYDSHLKEYAKGNYYNCHNEFLETMIKLGIPGIGILIIMLFAPFLWEKNYQQNRILLIFCLLIAIHFLFESMLERLHGVVFFSYFYSFLHATGDKA